MDDQVTQCAQIGVFSWCELMTTDVEKARAFYTKLFNWTTEDFPNPDMPYLVIKVGDKGIGGIMRMPEDAKGMPPMWGAYVTVADVDATARTARQLGATLLVEPRDIKGVGRFCVTQDPQGAVISAITYVAM